MCAPTFLGVHEKSKGADVSVLAGAPSRLNTTLAVFAVCAAILCVLFTSTFAPLANGCPSIVSAVTCATAAAGAGLASGTCARIKRITSKFMG